MTLRLDDQMELQYISGGQLRIDGGSMFGVVPKVLWQQKCAPDESNRILMETNCLLIRSQGKTILIDTGYGSKASERERDNLGLETGHPLCTHLSQVGVRPEEIDLVVLTHLHFDHAGGATLTEEGHLQPTFPRARYVVQQQEWEDATAALPELAGAYLEHDFAPLAESGQLELIDGDVELLPGIVTRLTGGHTRGHQIVQLGRGNRQALYLADLCPLSAHLRTRWSMAYDQYPLTLRRVKPAILGEAADHGWLVFFEHDPEVKAAYLERDPKREFVVRETVSLE